MASTSLTNTLLNPETVSALTGLTGLTDITDKLKSGLTGLTDLTGLTNIGEKNAAYSNASDTLKGLLGENSAAYDSILQLIQGTGTATQNALGGSQSVSDWLSSVKDSASKDYSVDSSKLENYDYRKSVSDFLDPNADYNIGHATKAAQNSLAGQGGLFSGGAGEQLAATASEKAADLYKDAQQQYNAEKNFDYGKLTDSLDLEQSNNQTAMTQANNNVSNLGSIANEYLSSTQNTSDNVVNALLGKLSNDTDIQTALANLGISKASEGGFMSQLLGGLFG